MAPSDFWDLSREERHERMQRAYDTNTCSICEKPIEEGQPCDGSLVAHWDCAHPPDEPTLEELSDSITRTTKKLQRLIRKL